jgi:tetratricopeptide (TPR) repeat protein
MTLIPVTFFLILECTLRLVGFGYPTDFFVDAPRPGAVMTNQKFGWRFFPRRLARAPVPAVIQKVAGEDVYRIVVIGGSAARGTPEPAFSFGRILEVLLEETYPGAKFEVINGAMTAINSHVALPIVRNAVELKPDLLLVYLGNNEVVGPYGAATVFRPFSPRLGVIRTGLAAKTSRLGQLVDEGLSRRAGQQGEWRGMEMFLEQQIAASDVRLVGVYDHFRANLNDLVMVARKAGVQVVLSTVAVNLRHQPPFASLRRSDLAAPDLARFKKFLEAAQAALAKADPNSALAHLAAAEALDQEYAELHFHRGRALLALHRGEEAGKSFSQARDLDALRFRADSRTNAVIAEVAVATGSPLVDAAGVFLNGGGMAEPLPGRKLFYEHVHLNLAGGFALAQAFMGEVERLLPPEIVAQRTSSLAPNLVTVGERPAFSLYDAEGMEREIFNLVSRPPFTGQWGHRQDLIARRAVLRRMRQGFGDKAWRRATALYEARLAVRTDDLQTRRRFAELLESQGEHGRAAEHWQKLLQTVPDILSWYDAYANANSNAGRESEAIKTLKFALRRFPEEEARIFANLGSVYEKAGEDTKAADAYRRSWKADPSVAVALYNLATMEARSGDLVRATKLYQELLEHHPKFTSGLHNLGVALERQGNLPAASRMYRREIASNPEDPAGYNSLGLVLAERGDGEGALTAYFEALERDPSYEPALFNLADELLSRGFSAQALVHYQKGLILEPENFQARQNLAAARRALGG